MSKVHVSSISKYAWIRQMMHAIVGFFSNMLCKCLVSIFLRFCGQGLLFPNLRNSHTVLIYLFSILTIRIGFGLFAYGSLFFYPEWNTTDCVYVWERERKDRERDEHWNAPSEGFAINYREESSVKNKHTIIRIDKLCSFRFHSK